MEQRQETLQTSKVTSMPGRRPGFADSIKARLREIVMAILGLCVLAAGLATNNGSLLSALLPLAGICILTFAIMFWFFTPSRELRSEVCDALAVADSITINGLLATMPIKSNGVYVPSGQIGKTKVFLLLSDESGDNPMPEVTGNEGITMIEGGQTNGIYVTPPGEGLLEHAKALGASFNPEYMEKEMRESMVDALELASDLRIRRDGDHVSVALYNIANKGLCQALRKEEPEACARLGCPVCSFAGCMVAESTGKKTRINGVDVSGDRILLTYDLF